ncbi:Rv3654c family TadE-like protein [Streptomyces sp. NPDC048332]|uniref:Rv3654c family TadE-like protein n=1 Tax=unclassified Streptomyces TaxID=2593676 RepID=UPI00342F18BE
MTAWPGSRRTARGPSGLRMRGRPRDQGLATVWAAVTTTTLCVVFAVVLALGQVVAVRHRAAGAADLAALAAADRALEGAVAACGSARSVAAAQGAEVVRCAVQGEIADVTARVRRGPYAPEVRSRAGPPTAAPTGRSGRPPPPGRAGRTGGVP